MSWGAAPYEKINMNNSINPLTKFPLTGASNYKNDFRILPNSEKYGPVMNSYTSSLG